MKFKIILSVCALFASTTLMASGHDILSGAWRVKSVAGYSSSFGMSEKQINYLIGKRLIFGKSKIEVGRDTCLSPRLHFTEEDMFDFFYNGYRTDPDDLRLPERVTIATIECSNIFDISIFALDGRNRLIFEKLGVFYEAIRIKP
ncbi:hypothetical protein FAZ69_12775 [Trinickia terrae]|uniref:Lipocalin-like domain-containing protein n=1 Tax=Trinickia terrae TaxID=2571161 RepID=A0A4U1I8J7_9BURK|nr:hypothetical protein [Trinickia terrae]TKC89776.1 hypothetical protein FAZ69_12775 [Trinickia terrae]